MKRVDICPPIGLSSNVGQTRGFQAIQLAFHGTGERTLPTALHMHNKEVDLHNTVSQPDILVI